MTAQVLVAVAAVAGVAIAPFVSEAVMRWLLARKRRS
jgi:hypothetical protein